MHNLTDQRAKRRSRQRELVADCAIELAHELSPAKVRKALAGLPEPDRTRVLALVKEFKNRFSRWVKG